jgi:hypothetical protein
MPDSRRVIGGALWARADAVTHDAKRVYGAALSKTWLKGTVIELSSTRTHEHSKRSTTFVTASYMVGNKEYVKILPLAVTKAILPEGAIDPTRAENPINANPTAPIALPPPEVPPPAEATLVEASSAEDQTEDNTTPTLPSIDGDELLRAILPGSPSENIQHEPHVAASPPRNNNVASVNHGRTWTLGETDVDVNGPVPRRYWKMACQYNVGREYYPGCDESRKYRPYDYFMACFPSKQLKYMVDETSKRLRADNKVGTSLGELLKFFGVTILMTAFEFGERHSLWEKNHHRSCKYIPAPHFGQTGMSRDRYCHILRHLTWSHQPKERPPNMTSENHRWMLVQDFVIRFNEHRASHYSCSDAICVDESISRWYGLGGHWINMGLPMYVAIERKPDNGCEIQNACDGRSGIMMQLKLVRSATAEALYVNKDPENMTAEDYEAISVREASNG